MNIPNDTKKDRKTNTTEQNIYDADDDISMTSYDIDKTVATQAGSVYGTSGYGVSTTCSKTWGPDGTATIKYNQTTELLKDDKLTISEKVTDGERDNSGAVHGVCDRTLTVTQISTGEILSNETKQDLYSSKQEAISK